MSAVPELEPDNDFIPKNFVPEKRYILAQSLFDHSDVRFLYEVQTMRAHPVADFVREDQLIGKGFSINYCSYTGTFTGTEQKNDCDLIYKRDEKQHGFKIKDVMNYFLLIEGNFVEGIYQNINGDKFYQINNLPAL